MNKKIKTLLPFALYEELQNMDQLDPKEMKLNMKKNMDRMVI